jgi:4'-phosphopantetheinyl transferase
MPELYQGPQRLQPPAIDLWLLSTENVAAADLAVLKACLGPQEQEQLQHLRLAQAQRQLITSRGCLRHLLSRYIDQPPESLSFSYGPRGKPALDLTSHGKHQALQFNLSHSGERLLVAVSGADSVRAIGVDLEVLRPITHLPGLCRRYLTPTEAAQVLSQPNSQVDQQFLRYWTGKEACFKALGLGIADSMQSLELALNYPELTPNPTSVGVMALGDLEHPGQLYQWQPEPGYVGAIAVQLAPQLTPNFRLYQTTPAALIGDHSRSAGLPGKRHDGVK